MKADKAFLSALIATARPPSRSHKTARELSKKLMGSFLRLGSETPDNLNCFHHVGFGLVGRPQSRGPSWGLKLKKKNVLLSEIFNTLEGTKPPRNISAEFKLTQDEWDAAIRMMVMILSVLETDLHQ